MSLVTFRFEVMWQNIDQKSLIWQTKEQNLLGIIIDKNMKLDTSNTLQKIRKETLCTGMNM